MIIVVVFASKILRKLSEIESLLRMLCCDHGGCGSEASCRGASTFFTIAMIFYEVEEENLSDTFANAAIYFLHRFSMAV